MRSIVLMTGWMVACQNEPVPSAYEPANLERATVVLDDPEGFEGTRQDQIGNLRIDGTGQDFVLNISTSAEDVTVHSPGRSDLSALDGLTDVRMSVARAPLSDELSLSIVDSADELVYLIEPVEAGALTVEQFGQGLVGEGDDLGSAVVDGFDLSFTSALIRTDAGDVALLPGEPQEVVIEGVTYRAVLLAAYTSSYTLGAAPECTGASARAAFELLRVEAGAADLSVIVRAEGAELPLSQCTADPV